LANLKNVFATEAKHSRDQGVRHTDEFSATMLAAISTTLQALADRGDALLRRQLPCEAYRFFCLMKETICLENSEKSSRFFLEYQK